MALDSADFGKVTVSDQDIAAAAEALRRGELVGIPTETVYGLAADASSKLAVAAVFAAKGRPADHPLIIHIAWDNWYDHLQNLAVDVSPAALKLIEAFWPGPLTLVFKKSAAVGRFVTGGLDTVGIRCPDSPAMQRLLTGFPAGLAAPSANRFKGVSPTMASHVRDELGRAVAMVLDGGDCSIGVESTIVDTTSEPLMVLRPGSVTLEALKAVLGSGRVVVRPESGRVTHSPGQLEAHYQPRASVVVCSPADMATHLEGRSEGANEWVLRCDGSEEGMRQLARRLYAEFREADSRGVAVIVVELPPNIGLGVAIRDRLRRASAGSEQTLYQPKR